MNQEEATNFISANYRILRTEWVEAEVKGLTDILFVWELEAPDQLATGYSDRAEALTKLKNDSERWNDIIADAKEKLERPAGENRAWLILDTDDGTALMRITRPPAAGVA